MDYNFTNENKADRRQEILTKGLGLKKRKENSTTSFISSPYLLTECVN